MSTIQAVLDSRPPIDQQLLSELAKGPLKRHLHGQNATSDPSDIEGLWHGLLSSTLSHDSNEKYLTTACNCISVFLLNAASSPVGGVKLFCSSRKVWFEGFECVQKAFDGGKTKPALQVLETLAHLLNEHPDRAIASEVLSESAHRLLNVLLTGTPTRQIKSACIALTCFVKKTELLSELEDTVAEALKKVSTSWRRYLLQNGISVGSADHHSTSRHLFLALLLAVRNLETRSAALKLFSLLLHAEGWTSNCTPAQSAAEAIELLVLDDTASLGDFADNVIPVILDDALRYETFCNLYRPSSDCSEARLALYLSVLKAGRLKKFVSEAELPSKVGEAAGDSHDERTSGDPYVSFRLLLRSGSPRVRIHAYNLLTATFGTTTVVPAGVLQCLLSSLRYLHDDNDAYERGEVMSITRRLLRRLESGRTHLQKRTAPRPIHDENTLEYYHDFLRRFGQFLLVELDPAISYQRHILALQTLQLLVKSAPEVWLDLVSFACSLCGLVLDPFDDVRAVASLLLKEIVSFDAGGVTQKLFSAMVPDANALSSRTCRHDHADAAGRLMGIALSQQWNVGHGHTTIVDLLQSLSMNVKGANSIGPSSSFPLHATLLGFSYCLRSGVESVQSMCDDLLDVCQRVWTSVQPQLCVDTPEREAEGTEEESLSGPKDLLAYSWRALRDSSLLLQSILQVGPENNATLSQIGWLCMEQLTLLRHRGAFSTVAQTFSQACEKARSARDLLTQQLVNDWYKAAVQEIEKQSTKLTRRSAGLPAMICAILSATDAEMFDSGFTDLKTLASHAVVLEAECQNEPALPQVHALNCLKDIMTNSRFRTCSEQYVGEMLELAAESLSSSIWAIRNCGLMLLRACMGRLESQGLEPDDESTEQNNIESVRKRPLTVAMRLLEYGEDVLEALTRRSEIIFAGLDLAKLVGSTRVESMRLNNLIYLQLGNPVWAIREHAAHVLAARMTAHHDDMLDLFGIPMNCPENMLHGCMLYNRYVHKSIRQREDGNTALNPAIDISWLIGMLATLSGADHSPYSTAAFLDILNDLMLHGLRCGSIFSKSEEELKALNVDIIEERAHIIKERDSSNASCHSRALLNRVLHLFVRRDHRHQSVLDALIEDLAEDSDAALFVMEHVEDLQLQITQQMFDFLIKLAVANQADDVRALAMAALAINMESESSDSHHERAASLWPILNEFRHRDRTLLTASVRLVGCLIQSQLLGQGSTISPQLSCRLRSWLDLITVATKDQLEFSTRLGSATALKHCGATIVLRIDEDGTQEGKEAMMLLLLTVYDQLNDDDGEIRAIAEQTAWNILQVGQQTLGFSIPECALAARESMLKLLTDRFGSGEGLPRLAMQRLIGESNDYASKLQTSCSAVFQESVYDRLGHIRASMNDLFAEEKQNLYIDDLDEVNKWSEVLRQCSLTQLDSKWHLAAVTWCAEGLNVLTSLLKFRDGHTPSRGLVAVGDSFHPLSPTYHTEILVLCLRVVKLARVLSDAKTGDSSDSPMDAKEIDNVKELRQKLGELRDTAWRTGAHRRVLEALGVAPGSERD